MNRSASSHRQQVIDRDRPIFTQPNTVNHSKLPVPLSGTGKSLSVICATFSWLRDFKNEKRSLVKEHLDELNKKLVDIEKENSVDWIEAHRRKTEIDEQRVGWVELNRKLERFDLRTEELKTRRQMYVKKQPFGANKKRKTGTFY